ncbi:MAG: YceI family protein [Flavobacteriales bacterium]
MRIATIGLTIAALSLLSCGQTKEAETTTTPDDTMYQIDTETVSLKWVAYKTTDKVGVGGEFGKINVKEYQLSESKDGALDGVSFSVPVSSLFTGNKDRDWKLVNLFFGVMDNTEFIKGTFHQGQEGTGNLDLEMNGTSTKLPYEYTVANDSIFISATMDVLNWNGQEAMDSLNVACYDLHKGKDGVSKTWSEVDIKASVAIARK